jgi:hypothetical protein
MLLVMAEVGAITKSKTNKQQGYSFRGIDDVYKCFYPLFVKHGIFCVPKIIDNKREERESKAGGTLLSTILTMEYTFFADDGSSVTAQVLGEGMDSGDKSAAKAMSVAHKMAFFQMFVIPTEELVDGDHESPQAGKKMDTGIIGKLKNESGYHREDSNLRRAPVERAPVTKPQPVPPKPAVDLGETVVPFGAERVAIKTLDRKSLTRKIDWAKGKDQYKDFVDKAQRFLRDDGLSQIFGEEPVPLDKQGRVYMSRVS